MSIHILFLMVVSLLIILLIASLKNRLPSQYLKKNSRNIFFRFQLSPSLKCLYINYAVKEITGFTPEEVKKQPDLIYTQISPEFNRELEKMIKGDFGKNQTFTYKWVHKKGKEIWLEMDVSSFYDWHGNFKGLTGIARDVTEQKEHEKKLTRLSYYDGLTGILNRNYIEQFFQAVNELILPLGVIICDINNLKDLNDYYGHYVGDDMIKKTSSILNRFSSPSLHVCRYGGDEFILLYEQTEERDLDFLVEKIEMEMESERLCILPIQVSIGSSIMKSASEWHEKIMEADRNMYKVKKVYKEREAQYS